MSQSPKDTNLIPLFPETEPAISDEQTVHPDASFEMPGLLGRAWSIGHEVVRLAQDTIDHVRELARHGPEPDWFTVAANQPLEIEGEQVILIHPRTGLSPMRAGYIYAPWGDNLGRGFGRQLLLQLATAPEIADMTLIASSNNVLGRKGANFHTANEVRMRVRDHIRGKNPDIKEASEIVITASMGGITGLYHAASTEETAQVIAAATAAKTDYLSMGHFVVSETASFIRRVATAKPAEWPNLARQALGALPTPRTILPMARQVKAMHDLPLQDIMSIPNAIPNRTRLVALVGAKDVASNCSNYLRFILDHGQLVIYAGKRHMELTYVSGVARQIVKAIENRADPEARLRLVGSPAAKAALSQRLFDLGVLPLSQTPNSQPPDAS